MPKNQPNPAPPASAVAGQSTAPHNPFVYDARSGGLLGADEVEIRAIYVLGAHDQTARYYALCLRSSKPGRDINGVYVLPARYYRLEPGQADYFAGLVAPDDFTRALSACASQQILGFEAVAARLLAKLQVALAAPLTVDLGLRSIVALRGQSSPFVGVELVLSRHRSGRSWVEYKLRGQGAVYRGEYSNWEPKNPADRQELVYLKVVRDLLDHEDGELRTHLLRIRTKVGELPRR